MRCQVKLAVRGGRPLTAGAGDRRLILSAFRRPVPHGPLLHTAHPALGLCPGETLPGVGSWETKQQAGDGNGGDWQKKGFMLSADGLYG